jgi:hypothetical protein
MIPQPSPSERRKKIRYAVTDIVEIYVVGAEGRFLGFGVLRDISESGAGIALGVSIAPGTLVDLTNEKGTLRALCRHTTLSSSGYMSGFEFVDGPNPSAVQAWSPLPATW